MLILDIKDLKKYYGERLILNIGELKLYSSDKVGLVGLNGSGKTTLLNIIGKEDTFYEGFIKTTMDPFYITQLTDNLKMESDQKQISKLGLKDKSKEFMSGGELTRLKIAQFITANPKFLLADEPTSNLDFQGINLLLEKLIGLDGCMIIISHDRDLLDKVCNKIIELENGNIKIYEGNYTDYMILKDLEIKNQESEYQKYINEKTRLENIIIGTKMKSSKINGPPKRMGLSEARLHKMGGQKAKRNLDSKVKALESRLDRLDVKSKAKKLETIELDIISNEIYSKVVIEGKNVSKNFGKRILLRNSKFQIYNGSKVALIGDNGAGKTTLLKMLLDKSPNINISKRAHIGYFSQDLDILDVNKSILDNVLESSMSEQAEARNMLARLLFKKEDVYKKVNVLSGGERVKVSLAKILLSDFNILILDEPTNYLDINSIEVLEEALLAYEGTLLFVSHDKRLVQSVADSILYIEDNMINTFDGNLSEFNNRKNNGDSKSKDLFNQKILLENKLSNIMGLLSTSENSAEIYDLDLEYNKLLKQLNNIKGNLR